MAKSEVGVALGARIRAKRDAKNLSQAALAEMVDVTPNYLGTIERGEALPSLQTLMLLSKALDSELGALVGRRRDGWVDQLVAVAESVPAAQRGLVLDLVRSVVRHGGGPARADRIRKRAR